MIEQIFLESSNPCLFLFSIVSCTLCRDFVIVLFGSVTFA